MLQRAGCLLQQSIYFTIRWDTRDLPVCVWVLFNENLYFYIIEGNVFPIFKIIRASVHK